jgi:hypothetical protein
MKNLWFQFYKKNYKMIHIPVPHINGIGIPVLGPVLQKLILVPVLKIRLDFGLDLHWNH